MRVLVTGAAGFVGRHLVPRLAAEHEVVALVHSMPRYELHAAKTIVADLTSPSLVARLPRDVEVVVHLAQAYKMFPEHAAEIFAVNTGSTQRLADHARAVGVRRFILASSGSIYPPGPTPLREDAVARPTSFHPATKLMAEQVLSYYSDTIDSLSLRLFAPYGPGQTDRMIPRMIEAVRAGRSILLSRGGEPRINPIYIDDLVEVFSQAVDGAGASVVNVAGPTAVSIREIAEIAGRALDRAPVFVERDQDPVGDLVADTAAMHAAFRLSPMVEPRDGIRRMTSALVAGA